MSIPAVPAEGDMPPRAARHLKPGDGWVKCRCGRRHWGLLGAAGLFVVRYDPANRPQAVVLQHRALWSDQGGTWGIPGGALMPDESPVDGALREAGEEAGIVAASIQIMGTRILDHTDWRYTTVLARAVADLDPRPTDPESLDVRWVPVPEVTTLPLLAAFAEAWPGLVELASAAVPAPRSSSPTESATG